MTKEQRFWEKVKKGDVCWNWIGAKSNEGYGSFRDGPSNTPAHRFAYELLVGPIPPGRLLDHLCRNPSCVNPDHLEPVTNRENVLRGKSPPAVHAAKTHCMRGHEFTEENTYVNPLGRRTCRTCRSAYKRAWDAAHKEAA